jgi:hypothetical protein
MCNLYSITTNQEAIIALFRVIHLLVLFSGTGALQNAEPLGNGDKLN